MMKSNLLSICRLINMINPTLQEPQNSVVAVNIDRERLEEIRKRKGIPIRTLERKINLSKSRYYRWLRYQSDLPLELIIGLKKLLNMSDRELLNLFVNSTDEQIQMLSLVIYTSMSNEENDLKHFVEIRSSLEKYRNSNEDNFAYKLILAYADLTLHCKAKRDPGNSLKKIEDYFLSIDYFTMYDVLLYLATLRTKIDYSLAPTAMEKESIILENSILKKLSSEQLKEWNEIIVGCVIDLSLCLVDMNSHAQAIQLLNKATVILDKKKTTSHQTKEVFDLLSYLFVNDNLTSKDEVIQKTKRDIQHLSFYLPENEYKFLKNLTVKEKYVFG
ncbi:helix-turn-helix domain-containing protein [Candidatus Enterococcus ferrettii]|uniref:HTH cro/C1-type domain-containing protein n=1 Tax=Candidatus Enterococcus ferrettii TaxID=2815324 RepID=A0ABV0ET35_9ENTE|nr:helix-turn-helix transcriptional regulator [Enterococcus sp. 665A]